MNRSLTSGQTSKPPATNKGLLTAEKMMIAAGVLGFLLALVCGIWVLMNGGEVLPEGDISKAVSFDAAIGIFLISTALVSPLAYTSVHKRKLFAWSYVVLALYSYFAETVQQFRGINPRFTASTVLFDNVVAMGFSLVALLLIVFYLIFAASFFRAQAMRTNPELVLAVRYSTLAILLSFAAGIWISVHGGRYIGDDGNIIWLHGLGFHAMQALPLTAWFVRRSTLHASRRFRLIHGTGLLYLFGLIAIGWQTALGNPLLDVSPLPIAAAAAFLGAFGLGLYALRAALFGSSKHDHHARIGR